MKKVTTTLSSIIILCRQLENTVGFYSEVLGLKVIRQSPSLAELKDADNNSFILRHIPGNEAALSKGYSPILCFNVTDFNAVFQKIKLNGAHIDGEPIIKGDDYKLVTFRGPQGQILTVRQVREEEESEAAETQQPDPTTDEIKKLLEKIRL